MPHSIQSTLKFPLQIRPLHPRRHLLRPRVLVTPRIVALWDRHLLSWLSLLALSIGNLLRRPHALAESLHFLEDHVAHVGDVFDGFETKVEWGRAGGLVGGVVPDGQVPVFEGFFDADTLARVEG